MMDAVVLVGGLGSRLQSVVRNVPKPLAPVNGRPFLDLILEQLDRFGAIGRVVLATGYKGEMIRTRYQANRRYGFAICVSHEEVPLGTGGGLLQALGQVTSQRLLVLNGDSYVDFELAALQAMHIARKSAVTLVAVQVPDAARFGCVRLRLSDDHVLGFEEKHGRPESGWVNAGCYLVERDMLPVWHGQRLSLEIDILPPLLPRTYALRVVGKFIDIGIPDSYAAADSYLHEDIPMAASMSASEPYSVGKINVVREKEVAFESPDHLVPWGTKRDNSRNHRFNDKLYELFAGHSGTLALLDMGCSGGGFVKDCLDDGCLAVGLEGSDFSKRFRRAEWRTIPEYLFTCDVTGRFDVFRESADGSQRVMFDVVTCWEMIEHLTEDGIERVSGNVKRHLSPGGLWIMSVSPNEEVIDGVRLHQTVQPRDWWIRKFESLGLHHVQDVVDYFNTQFIRGPKYDGPGSFILALTQDRTKVPKVPREKAATRMFDLWLGSRPQRLLRRIVLGR